MASMLFLVGLFGLVWLGKVWIMVPAALLLFDSYYAIILVVLFV
jgi:hypothetical protein